VISSCGEPLNAEVVEFFRRVWGVTPMDHFGATEFGLPIGNHNAIDMAIKPGSMGLPAPGQTMAIVDEHGAELAPDAVGFIAQRSNDGSRYWLRYWNDEAATAALYRGGWACTGDLARRDASGYFWFEGRADDIIKSSGYRIGPFELESALLRHHAVVEAAVVGVPDRLRGQSIKAFVVTRPGVVCAQPLADELIALVRSVCGRHQFPHAVEFVATLPKTETGKIQRFLLRQNTDEAIP
jgi:acetyl-CoA synthetase